MNVLESIMAQRREDVAAARRTVPLAELEARAAARCPRPFAARLAAARGPAVIAEMKQASPSAGALRTGDYRPADLARLYERHGATALSVLTEPHRFHGALEHLRAARDAVALPVLRKDFICDEYQLAEAAAWGADAVLLIVAALDAGQLAALHAAAVGRGLDVLVEAHTAAELEAALALPGAVVGVNSRDLKSLKTDLDVARRLGARVPSGRLAVAESGIRTRADVESLAAAGYRGFLVGEVLMRAADPGAKLAELLGAAGPGTEP